MEKIKKTIRVKEAEVIFNKKQLLCSNNFSLEIKKKLIKCCIWSVALYRSETWTIGKNEEMVVNAFETWCSRKILKIKWTDTITNDEVFQKAKEERLLLKILKNRCHSLIGHIIRHNEFEVNILEGAISRKKGHRKTSTTILKVSRQKHWNRRLNSNEKNDLQQFQMESCQPIKRLKDKKKRKAWAQKKSLSAALSVGSDIPFLGEDYNRAAWELLWAGRNKVLRYTHTHTHTHTHHSHSVQHKTLVD